MLLVKTSQDQEKNAVGTSSQDNQLFPALEGEDTKVSTLKHRAPSPDGSPEAKKARMGSIKQLSSCSQSVAERLKESTLKLQDKSTQNGTAPAPVAEVKSPFNTFNGQKSLTEEQQNQVRVIAQHLKELGLREAVNALVEETGCKIEHTYASQIRKSIKNGDFYDCLLVLDKAKSYITPEQYAAARVEFIKHHLLTLLNNEEYLKCLPIIRAEFSRYMTDKEFKSITNLLFLNKDRIKKTAVMQTFRSPDYLEKVARTIETIMPSSFMLQEARLENIFNKALQHQTHSCAYQIATRVTDKGEDSILRDHRCDNHDYEIHDAQKIMGHEVFRSCFSHNGKYFVTGSTTKRVALYKCMKKTATLLHIRNLKMKNNHKSNRVSDIAWSWDSKLVAICGPTRTNFENVKCVIYDVTTGKIHKIIKKPSNTEFTSVCFSYNSYKIAIANENGSFMVLDVSNPHEKESSQVCQFDGLRIRRIHPLKSGNFIALDTHNRIRKYILPPNKRDETVIREFASICNFVVHKTDKYLLTVTNQSVHLWDMVERSLVRNYRAFATKEIYIDCAFGGPNEEFFTLGSPEGQIYIYNINESEPFMQIKGHSGHVNAINWHPKTGMIASSGNDGALRVWHVGCELDSCKTNVIKSAAPTSEKKLKKEELRAKKRVSKELRSRIRDRKRHAKENAAQKEKEKEDETHRAEETEKEVAVAKIVEKNLELSPNSISASLPPLAKTPIKEIPRKKKESNAKGSSTKALENAPSDNNREKEKRKRRQVKPNFFANYISLAPPTVIEKSKRKTVRKKMKIKQTKHVDGSASMEVEESSNGKAALSGNENGSSKSHL